MQKVQRKSVLAKHDYEVGMDSKLGLMSSKAMETRYYEGCGQEGPIRCIFLGEFHPVAGPKISCQFPEDYISKEVFDSISAYIIPKPLIQKCTMTINALGHKIVGYPIRIDNSRYERNVYVFNLCFVCDSWSKTVQYEPVVKKLGEHLMTMEEETKFVSSGSSKLPTLLAHLLHDLNTHRKATIVDDILWSIEDYEEELEMRQELQRIEAVDPPVVQEHRARPLVRDAERRSQDPQGSKNDKKPPEKQSCRPRSRSRLRTSSRSPSRSPSRSRSQSRTQSQSQSASPPGLQEATPTPRKSRSRSPLSRPRSRNKCVATETANLYTQNKYLEPRATTYINNDIMFPDSCLETFISTFRNIHRSITKINRINRNLARQYNMRNIWSGFDTNSTFTMVTKWLRSINAYWYLFDWDVTETVYYAMAELSKCASRWAADHSTAHYKWKHWQAKVVLVYAAYQHFGSLLPEMIYKTSDDEETLEQYYHGKVLALYRCGIKGTRAVDCIIHGICDDEIRNVAKNSGFKYPEELLLYLRSVKVVDVDSTYYISSHSHK